jgi:phage shock protein C
LKARLERSNANRVIAGVCGGIAEYLAIDATLVRVVFVGLAVFGGVGLLLYIVLLILMPLPGQPAPFTTASPPSSPASAETTARMDADSSAAPPTTVAPVDPAIREAEAERRRTAVGYLLIALGVVFLLSNAGAFRFVQWQFLWPLVLIGIGVLFLVQRVRS